MSEYVEVKDSLENILDMGNRLASMGDDLTQSVSGFVQRVSDLEADQRVFPAGDEFVESFLPNYHADTPNGTGGTVAMNQAVKDNAAGLGDAMHQLGQYVADSMNMYQLQEIQNTTAITSAPIP